MSAIFTMNLNYGSKTYGETRSAERAAIQRALCDAARGVGDGTSTDGEIRDANGVSIGSWNYAPQAKT